MSRTSTSPSLPAVTVRQPHQRIERRAIWWWMLKALLGPGILLAALIVAAVIWHPARPWLVGPTIAVGALLLAKIAVEPWLRYRVHRWEIGEHATYAVTGWFVREWRVAPTSRIQTVDAVRGPLEQMLGLSTLRVTTASSAGDITIAGLDRTTADAAVEQLAAVAEVTPGDAT